MIQHQNKIIENSIVYNICDFIVIFIEERDFHNCKVLTVIIT